MKRKQTIRRILSGILCVAIFPSLAAQQSLSGTYNMTAEQTTLTLTLSQSGNQITGTLRSATGLSYLLQGEVMEGAGAGVCSGEDGYVYFEVYVEGSELTLGLIEPDQFNMPDYENAQYLLFARQTGQISPAAQTGSPTQSVSGNQARSANPEPVQQGHSIPQPGNVTQSVSPTPSGPQGNAGNEVSDPSWGFSIVPPSGWVHQKTAEGAILGHNTVAGMILVLPHRAGNMQQMQQELMEGLQEDRNYLMLNGAISQDGNNILKGDYSGVMDGTQVKAKGMGVLSPYGGGVYLIAVTTPEKLGPELVNAAESIARNMKFSKQESSNLSRHFTGNWSTFTTNTSTWICFCPDGVYSEQYESSYSGKMTDGYGVQTGAWGTAGQDNSQGRWTVRGTKESGQIIVILNNGNELVFNYKVHQENGRYFYNEYWMNGKLYAKKTD